MDRDGNRRILWEHFQDVVWLLFLEGGLVAGVELLDRVFPALRSSWQVLHTLLIWSAIATVAQFALISFLLLLVRNLRELKRALRQTREGRR